MKPIKLALCTLLPFLWGQNALAQNGSPYLNTSRYIVVDQFGYRPESEKIAVIRNPVVGNDASESYAPSDNFALIVASDDSPIFTGPIDPWNSGATHDDSGDQAWHFDFSSVTTPGVYYVKDLGTGERSYPFEIKENVYAEALKQAFRVFFYQRAGFAKEEPYADEGWTDDASHIGPLQDKNARRYDAPEDASTERDIHGGWYDAGDLNRYTNWTANYIHAMLLSYEENPKVWHDNFNIPESGNGISDLLDEMKWGLDHLLRLQNDDGSVQSIIGSAHASPPSLAADPSLYGAINTSSALSSSGAFAYAAKIYGSAGMTDYAATLQQAAIDAWNWADANPDVVWKNNDAAYGSAGVGAGQQETDDYGRLSYKMRAAAHLFENTGEAAYQAYFENNYKTLHMFDFNDFVYPYELSQQQALVYYSQLPDVSPTVAADIVNSYNIGMGKADNFAAHDNDVDPYLAHMGSYTWGSNGIKGRQGIQFTLIPIFGLDEARSEDAWKFAERYLHYLHGVNPQSRVYLTNMYEHGGDYCANQIYHTWFSNGSPLWDEAGVSVFGPAPGILSGGPNPSYAWDSCCPSGCGSDANNARCDSDFIAPLSNQPPQKAYMDFNDSWPLNSWSVTENSMGYQVQYLRLIANFVSTPIILDIGDEDSDGLANSFEEFFALESGTSDSLLQRFSIQSTPTKRELTFSYSKTANFDMLGMEWSNQEGNRS
ncbi:MAG: glycoside hydrolase family 9 protein, partial [Verrucomicrobiota bacterium]